MGIAVWSGDRRGENIVAIIYEYRHARVYTHARSLAARRDFRFSLGDASPEGRGIANKKTKYKKSKFEKKNRKEKKNGERARHGDASGKEESHRALERRPRLR